jgi:hypothetical protein
MRWLLFIWMMGVINLLQAQQKVAVGDSNSYVQYRFMDVSTYRNQKVFQYKAVAAPKENLWSRFWSWVWEVFDEIMRTKSGRTSVYTTIIIVAIALIVFFIWKIIGMNKVRLFDRNNEQLNYITGTDDIHEIDFSDAINKAIAGNNYFLAVRLLYLKSLKLLSDKNIIDWELDKTNHAYVEEMKSHPQQQQFAYLTTHFEYVWYGNNNVSKEEFEKIHQSFTQFFQQL